jgi:hypothetical protein
MMSSPAGAAPTEPGNGSPTTQPRYMSVTPGIALTAASHQPSYSRQLSSRSAAGPVLSGRPRSQSPLSRHDRGLGADAAVIRKRKLAVLGADQAVALGELDDAVHETGVPAGDGRDRQPADPSPSYLRECSAASVRFADNYANRRLSSQHVNKQFHFRLGARSPDFFLRSTRLAKVT